MPFEPLKTDEKLTEPVKRKPDMDSKFLTGCLSVAALSFVVWGLAAWPFFLLPVQTKEGLAYAGLMGALPALVLGVTSVVRWGVTGATGFAGGALSVGLFVFLHLQNLMLGDFEMIEGLTKPDYPLFWSWLVPLGWCLLVASFIFTFLPKGEFEDEAGPGSSR